MRLLDAATVVNGSGRWTAGQDMDTRSCAISVTLEEACDVGTSTVITGAEDPDKYTVRAFGINALLPRSVGCERKDDNEWTAEQLRDATEQAIGRALVVEPFTGSETWVGVTGVATVPYTPATPVVAATLAAAVIAGRKAWVATNIGNAVLHVPSSLLPALIDQRIVMDDGDETVWGDAVVVNDGYEALDQPFWTGPITIYLDAVQSGETGRTILGNRVDYSAYRVAAVDMAPCAVVLVGGYPT